ncbi:TPA: hypothetical protein N2919_002044 [Vibrio parahaemolyticus]|uniref:hypothetical protein n=1 Tax=Vibrio parahaemolyticus TaxID=670 RepID=UPI001EF7B260|nr:hypothetical protein [Vibrio parahaemolyticus]MCG7777332.1 hypothetical protein [Vibrio parahaemolyticus]HCH4208068.1 hypothetical protein [Vibrio parahaemolyticus]HCH6053384.1 hypothetical protein [Vibrio parahaemolyticus]HCM1468184.1 hypothetical protein [Vibrio parahaemolyticus]HCM1527122.1 hypothetical protein [Vibrio parahaemolyticus]
MKRIMMLMCLMLGTSQAIAAEQIKWQKLGEVFYYAIPYNAAPYTKPMFVLSCVTGYPNRIGGFETSLGVRSSPILNASDKARCEKVLACNEDNKSKKCSG